jgi:hypothetical protein
LSQFWEADLLPYPQGEIKMATRTISSGDQYSLGDYLIVKEKIAESYLVIFTLLFELR